MLISASLHAASRLAQRHITDTDIQFVLDRGMKIHNGGALFVFLGHRQIPLHQRRDDHICKLEGLILVLSTDGHQLITAYKNKRGLRDIRKKCKRYLLKTAA